ncbi:MAG: RDD family protein [Gammaproteobacteria bacterium]|nr:RDD family protein [Gammaproteobacteria bacterium]
MNTPVYTPYIGLPQRVAAVLLDFVCVSFLSSLIGWLLMLSYPDAEAVVSTAGDTARLFAAPTVAVLWWRFQGTPGKLLLGCRIVDARNGGRPRLWQVLVRLFGYALSALPLGLGFLWVIWDKRHQGWHDKLARTLVVEDDESRLSLHQLADAFR